MSISRITKSDKEEYIELAKEFYSSEAVLHKIDESHFGLAFEEMNSANPRIFGYFIKKGSDTAGYILLAEYYSQEAGGRVIWIDELYVRSACRGGGLGRAAIEEIMSIFKDAAAFRLEIEPSNSGAKRLYQRLGFEDLGYSQMICQKHKI